MFGIVFLTGVGSWNEAFGVIISDWVPWCLSANAKGVWKDFQLGLTWTLD